MPDVPLRFPPAPPVVYGRSVRKMKILLVRKLFVTRTKVIQRAVIRKRCSGGRRLLVLFTARGAQLLRMLHRIVTFQVELGVKRGARERLSERTREKGGARGIAEGAGDGKLG